MAKTERFNTGFLLVEHPREELFLSVTQAFEHGPGIQRDGITSPRMSDPHSVPRIRNHFQLPHAPRLSPTTDAYVQRAGTWTLYQHVKKFVTERGNEWTVVGVQSNGDLTMNPWHVAYIGDSHVPQQNGHLCALLTAGGPVEPVGSRIYRSLVKWRDEAAIIRSRRYEFLSLRIEETPQGHALKLVEQEIAQNLDAQLGGLGTYNPTTKDLAPLVEFTLSGKPIVEQGIELSLTNAIDRFEDIRHIFKLPTIRATGFFREQAVTKLNFGEYQLFANLNERRAAIFSPVIIDLDIDGRVTMQWQDVADTLKKEHFKESPESPTRRGQFRRYLDQADRNKVEIFFPHNVYPFGVLGLQEGQAGQASGLVCLSSGGLSGRVGNTLEGTARIMFDFFACSDAMILDEGYDVFFIANPALSTGTYKYSNETMLQKILTFTKTRMERDHEESRKTASNYNFSGGMKSFPLNKELIRELEDDYQTAGPVDYSDVLLVEPQRSQMRSVLIFAAKNSA